MNACSVAEPGAAQQVFGVVTVTNAMLPLLRRAEAARIVNVSSEVGSVGWQTNPASPLAQMPASALPW
jgi:NAD(P)-dependent dehydrogenase (short-subunit alcohol dehydrogenase family)